MLKLFEEVKNSCHHGCPLILAVITETHRRTPRGIGSYMLVSERGLACGTIGGGALEGEALNYAEKLLKEKRSAQVAFSRFQGRALRMPSLAEGDLVVWMQYIDPRRSDWQKICTAAIKLLQEDDGGYFLLHKDGRIPSILNNKSQILSGSPIEEACCFKGKAAVLTESYFSMSITGGERLLLFGGGHCAKALVPVLNSIGFRVNVFENRSEFAKEERFPDAKKVTLCDYNHISEVVSIKPEDYLVLMTSDHEYDLALLSEIMKEEYAYLGVMVSKSCSEEYREHLKKLGLPKEKIDGMYSPIGLKIRGVTPAEIAVSVAAELIFVRANRTKIKTLN